MPKLLKCVSLVVFISLFPLFAQGNVGKLQAYVDALAGAELYKKIDSSNINVWMESYRDEGAEFAKEYGISSPDKNLASYVDYLENVDKAFNQPYFDFLNNHPSIRRNQISKLETEHHYEQLNDIYQKSFLTYYLANRSNESNRNKLYYVLVSRTKGAAFSEDDLKLIRASMQFAKVVFKFEDVIELPQIEKENYPFARNNPGLGYQLQVETLLHDVSFDFYKAKADAAIVIAVTPEGLYPSPKWNYVFGMSDLKMGIMAISTSLLFDGVSQAQKAVRLLKIINHEIMHSLNVFHCDQYQCGINGYMNPNDLENAPLAFCPITSGQLWYRRNIEPITWYGALIQEAKTNPLHEVVDLKSEIEIWSKSRQILQKATTVKTDP